MLDFRRNSSSREYFSGPKRRRLTTWVMVLGGLTILVPRLLEWSGVIGRPNAVARDGRQGDRKALAAAQAADDALFRNQLAAAEVFPDAVVAPPVEPVKTVELPIKSYFPGVKPELLAKVVDGATLRGDGHAFFHLLQICAQNSSETLEKGSQGPISFTQLYTQPKEYRGDLVSLKGKVLAVEPVSLSAEDELARTYGVSNYFKLIIRLNERGDTAVVVFCLELPEGFPVRDGLREAIEVTGFSFKKMPDVSQKKTLQGIETGVAAFPVLLAKTIRWTKPLTAEEVARQGGSPLAIVTISLFVGAGVLVLLLWISRGRRGQPVRFTLHDTRSPPQFTGEPTDASAVLRELARRDREAAP